MIKDSEMGLVFVEILKDLLKENKLLILTIILLLGTALSIVWFTHSTRLLIIEKDQLTIQIEALKNEAINLRLEETIFSDKNRIENLAKKKLNMHLIQPKQEVLIVE